MSELLDLPRERLARFGAEALSDAELVALVLRTGGPAGDALQTARTLLGRDAGLRGLARAAERELRDAPGVGPAKSASLVASLEIGRRVASRTLDPGEPLRGPADLYHHFRARLRDARTEQFLVVLLDGRHRVMRTEPVSRGTLTASLVHPREVFRPAIREAAAAVALVHNHPSGDPTPSREDREITARLARAGDLLGIRVLDHVVVAEGGYHSLREDGDLSGEALTQDGVRRPGRRDAALARRATEP
ncbi:MAG: DNA repair protein RadC [Deltaproteobacteria bacterium]|nr:DNA repair protein RadC [Deltaproteobacteria bacterium]